MIVVPFEPWHLQRLQIQEAQKMFLPMMVDPNYAEELQGGYTLIDEVSVNVIGCAGVIDADFGRGLGWALLSRHTAPNLLRITREIQKRLTGFKRIEIVVDGDFTEAHRWAKMLGFVCETPDGMANYCDGRTHYLYSRLF